MRLLAVLLVFCACLGCSPRKSNSAPQGPGKSALFVPPESAAQLPEGPLRVLHHAPVGATDGPVELNIVFDRPVVALGTNTRADALLEITPAVAGEAHFLGSQAIVFRPKSGWPSATAFRVQLSSSLRALDGRGLDAPFAFEFTTPEPAFARVSPYDGARGQELTRVFELYANQPLSLAALTEHVAVSVVRQGVATAAKVRIEQPDSSDSQLFRVVPVTAWPRAADVVLSVTPGLVGSAGPRPMTTAFRAHFSTYAPFAFTTEAPCAARSGSRCEPDDGIAIVFNNPVKLQDVARALVFDPPLAKPLDPADYADYESDQIYLYGGLRPMTRYTARLAKPLRDVHGQSFSGARTLQFETAPYAASAYMPNSGELSEPREKAEMALIMRNVRQSRARITRLDSAQLIAEIASGVEPDQSAAVRGSDHVRLQRLANVGPAEEKALVIDIAPSLTAGRGVVQVEIEVGDATHRDVLARRLLAYTDLAPALKFGATGGAVWVTRFSNAQPVAGADVRVLGCGGIALAQGASDAAGVFRFALKETPECEVSTVVSLAGDLSFARQYAGLGPYGLTEHAEPYSASDMDALLFTERGVYKPGETMQLKAVVRKLTAAGFAVSREKVRFEVTDARERNLYSQELTLSEFGSAAASFVLPADVALGTLSVTASVAGHSFSTNAEVAQFRRVELSTEVSTARTAFVDGEVADVRVHAEYLFGASAALQPLTWAARRLAASVRPRGERFDGFSFEDQRRHFDSIQEADESEVRAGEAKLDASGDALLKVPVGAPNAGQPARYEIEATVDGLGGASAAGRTFVEVTPAAFLAGLRTQTALAEVGAKVQVEAVAAALSGELARGVQLNVSLDRRVYTTRAVLDDRGVRTHTTDVTDEPVAHCRAADGQPCAVTAKQPGLHFVRVEARDQRGRKSEASVPLYVYGAGMTAFGEDDGQVIALKAERAKYYAGEVARIVVPNPFANAEALITVERETVLSIERRSVQAGSVVIDVPVDDRFVPNAFVSVLLVRPRAAATEADDGRPDYRIGVVEIATDTARKKLQVAVTPSAPIVKPGAELGVDIQVRDHTGHGVTSELTLYAVDEGVLALTGYRTPDPYTHFYRPRGLSVWTSDARGSLVADHETADSLGEKGGSEGGGGGSDVRKDFRAVAYYASSVRTDPQGRAHLVFALPDSITKYRIMAVAVGQADAFGSGEAAVRTQKRLMLRASLPRVVRAGDQLKVGVAVHNETASTIAVDVRAALTGVTLVGAAVQRVQLAARSAREVLFDVRADHAGEARFTFSAKAGADDDALSVTRTILAPTSIETVTSVGSTDGRSSEQLAALPDLRQDVGGLRVRVATSSIAELGDVVRSLASYPHACTEQLSSRLLGLSSYFSLAAQGFDVEGVTRVELEAIVAELVQRQRADGGFVLWPDMESAGPSHFSAFLTAYALRALSAAADVGVTQSESTRASAHAFLAAYLRAERDRDALSGADATRSFVLEALAATGHIDNAYLATLAQRAAQLPAAARVSLFFTAARARAKHAPGADELATQLLAEVGHGIRMTASSAHVETNVADAYRAAMTSDVRATATLLLALLSFDPAHALVQPLARYLSEARGRDGTWRNTHDNAWGLHALTRYVAARERATPDFDARVRVGDTVLLEAHLKGRGQSREGLLAMAQLPRTGAALEIEKRGSGVLHHAASFSFARKELPRDTLERGFFIERSYERIKPVDLMQGADGMACERAEVGDYVRVTLRVAVGAERDFVVIEDPLPAGLEPVSSLFTTTSSGAEQSLGMHNDSYTHREIYDDRVAFAVTSMAPGVYHYSYMARAVTPGSYLVPVAKAEEMYHPETFGRTAGGRFDVVSK